MTKATFIMRARREQIIEAAVQTLDEIGFARASLAQIAKRADISTGLISYHFSDKQDLMNQVLEQLITQSATVILEQVFLGKDPLEQLQLYIQETLRYQREFPARQIALIEIVFQAKNTEEVPYYRMEDDGPDPLVEVLAEIIERGQEMGLLKRYHQTSLIHLIQGTIYEGMISQQELPEAKRYEEEIVAMVMEAVSLKR